MKTDKQAKVNRVKMLWQSQAEQNRACVYEDEVKRDKQRKHTGKQVKNGLCVLEFRDLERDEQRQETLISTTEQTVCF